MQVIKDAPGDGFVWDRRVLGGVYVPIQVIHGDNEDGEHNGSSGGPTEAQVQAMIEAAVRPLQAQLADAVKYGDKLVVAC